MWSAIAIAVVVLLAFFAVNWWVRRLNRNLKDEEKDLHQTAINHTNELTEEAARVRKVAAAKPTGSKAVESVRERVRKKRGR